MTVGRKLSFALVAAVFAVLAVSSWVRVHREVARFDADARRHHRVLGTTLGAAVEQLIEEEGEQAAATLVHHIDASRSGISIRWVSLSPGVPRHRLPKLPRAQLAPVARGEIVQLTQPRRDSDGEDYEDERLVSYFPIRGPSSGLGAIELVESLTPKSVYTGEAIRSTLLASLSVAVVCGLLAVLLGAYYVGRPVTRLVHKARQIGQGQFESPLELERRDELGMLASELNAMASQLAASRRAMEDQTEARLAALEQLRHAERLTTVGKLASAVAHEIGTPINVVAGHANLIVRRRVEGDEALSSAQVIVEQCARMTKLVRNLLDYARRRPPNRVCVNLHDILNETTQLLAPLAASREVALEVQGELQALASVDPAQLQQALANLVINAIQASPQKSTVRLTLELVTVARPDRDHSRERPTWRIGVADHGSGIPSEDLGRLFDPFFTTKPSGEGTGLGLSITRTIVEEHGGWVSVDSTVGRGARFELYLTPLRESCPSTSSS
ncbi:MAG: HAMP domain-containing histidine kinase [Polyangiaceae bacterium]|nr:HAMP domain-containing histidine kinase [Polyangiaceae bacterium]